MEKKSDTYQIAADIQWEYAGDGKVLRAGDGYYVASNLPHGCVCLEAGILIDTFSPMREDFMK